MKKLMSSDRVKVQHIVHNDSPKITTLCRLCGGKVGYDTDEEFCQECKEAIEFVKAIIKVSKGY